MMVYVQTFSLTLLKMDVHDLTQSAVGQQLCLQAFHWNSKDLAAKSCSSPGTTHSRNTPKLADKANNVMRAACPD